MSSFARFRFGTPATLLRDGARAAWGAGAWIVATTARRRRVERELRRLERLDDRLLRDIGLSTDELCKRCCGATSQAWA